MNWNRKASLLYFPVVALLFFSNFFAFFPGTMSSDSWMQWSEGQKGIYSDSSPPIMAWWWGWLKKYVWANMGSMLVFHLLTFWSAIYIFGRTLSRSSVFWSYLCLGLWFIPPVMSMMGVIWKDTGMALSLFFASVLMLRHSSEHRPLGLGSAAVIIIFLFYGTAIRYNAITALPPLCYWFAVCLPRAHRKKWGDMCIALVLSLGLYGATKIFDKSITTDYQNIADRIIIGSDIDAISKEINVKLYPVDDEDVSPFHAYVSMIVHYPTEWSQYRWDLFKELMRIGYSTSCRPYHWSEQPDNAAIRMWARSYLAITSQSFWFKGVLWLIIAIAMLGFSLRYLRTHRPIMLPVVLLNTSALMYILPYLVIAPSCDFRYIYWSVMATVCSILICGDFFKKGISQRIRNFRSKKLP